MSTLTAPLDAAEVMRRWHAEHRVVLTGVSWEAYKKLMHDVGERSLPHAYAFGILELMAKSNEHEILKSVLNQLIVVWAEENDISLAFGGEMTLQRDDIARAVDGDEIYWIGDLSWVRGNYDIDLTRDPPPTLVIESEVSTTAVDKLGIYSALGVPGVWRVSTSRLRVGRRQPDGQYQWGDESGVFPTLPTAELLKHLRQAATTPNHVAVIRAFRAWVRQRREG